MNTVLFSLRSLRQLALPLLLLPAVAIAADEAGTAPVPAPVPAPAPIPLLGGAPYWSVQAGLNRLSHWPATVSSHGASVDADLGLGRGAQAGLAWGRQFHHARYEVEFQHGRIDIERARLGSVSQNVSASGHYDALTANALHQAAVSPALSLYAGAGVGVARTRLPHISLPSGCACVPAADKRGLAWQLKGGAELRISAHGNVFVQAGRLSLPGPASATITYPRRAFTVVGIGYRHVF
ncbi:MAG: outer membrane protein [Gammaproteobacteria bacterium]